MHNRKAHWENIYTDKSPLEVSWHQEEPKLSLQLINKTQVSHDAEIIDVGGGASTLVDYLCERSYNNLSVLDISEKATKSTQKRLGDKAKAIKWYTEDITAFNPTQQFSVWHDRAVFHFLTEKSDRIKYVNILKTALKAKGHLILASFAIGGATKCSGLDIVQYDANKLITELGDGFELIEEVTEIHITPANKEQKFNYFHFIKK